MPANIPLPQSPPPSGDSLVVRILKKWITNDRVWGYARHAGTWLSTWLATHKLIGDDSGTAELVAGCVGNIAVLIWSWNADAKETMRQKAAGIARHVMTIGLGVLVFKGVISSDDANQIIQVAVGLIVSCGVSAAAGEKIVPQAPPENGP